MIHDHAVAQVPGRNPFHLLIGQGEVPDVNVLLHPFHMDGLGYDGHATLGVPAQSCLSCKKKKKSE